MGGAGLRLAATIGLMIACPLAARAQAPPAASRAEVPIQQLVLSDGTHRYAVPVRIGSVTLWAALDTGSTGLRVLARALGPADARPGGAADDVTYLTGLTLHGAHSDAEVAIGGVSGRIPIQVVSSVGCASAIPDCPAARVSPAEYGIEGDGLPGEGFDAILGTNMANADIANPLSALGVQRWLVELPRPGLAAPGRLVLNLTDNEVQGFIPLRAPPLARQRRDGLHDAVSGCLVNDAAKARACGPTLLDTGAPGLRVVNGGLGPAPWPDGALARLAFFDDAGRPRACQSFRIGGPFGFAKLSVETAASEPAAIYAGPLPYFVFSVLYDPRIDAIAVRPRPDVGVAPCS